MEPSQIYILISIIVLLIIGVIVFFIKKNKNQKRFTTLAALAFAFILAGIIFGENRLTGYGLMGIGVLLALVDIVRKTKK
jgi:asparagine N-glycosylation enzyme membrane subunit Stt3